MTDVLTIPADLKPADGRFGAGPSKIQTSHLDALAATGSTLMGTSHRQAPVRQVVADAHPYFRHDDSGDGAAVAIAYSPFHT